jgi:hypothetical protein
VEPRFYFAEQKMPKQVTYPERMEVVLEHPVILQREAPALSVQ